MNVLNNTRIVPLRATAVVEEQYMILINRIKKKVV